MDTLTNEFDVIRCWGVWHSNFGGIIASSDEAVVEDASE